MSDNAASHPPRMHWNDSFMLGLPAIDEQHELLFKVANRLLDHPEAFGRDEKVVDILTDLGKFLILHFQTEEAMMRTLGVPNDEYEHHVKAHNFIIDEYAELNLAVAHGRRHTAVEIFTLVRTWLHDHFHGNDLRLRDYAPARAD